MRATPHPAWLTLLLSAACSGGGGGGAPRLYVQPNGTGDGSGRSWENATSDLQAAIDATPPGGEVWAAAGTYLPPALPPASDPRDRCFRLRRGVTVRGGFAGHETALVQRSAAAGPSVLSGDLAGDDGPAFSGRSENAFHVVVAFDPESDGTLESFTLRGGYADGPGKGPSPNSRDQGSGLDVFNASPRIVRCTFEDNWSANHGAANDHGMDTVFEECLFRGNVAGLLGAGLYIHHHTATLAIACRFEDNWTAGDGAGAYSRSHEGAVLQACEFRRNHALRGAGLYVAPEGTLVVDDAYFEENEAQVGGGGIYADQATPLVRRSNFVRNAAGVDLTEGGGGGGGSGGGGIWGVLGAPIVEDCRFEENVASFGAGVYFIEDCLGTVRRSIFRGNTAQEAGGLYTLGSAVLAEDCHFEGNTALGGTFSVGGAMSHYFSNSTTRRCTFVGNSAELGGGGVYFEGEAPTLSDSTFRGNSAVGHHEGWGGGILFGYFSYGTVQNCLFVGNSAQRGGGYFEMAFADALVANCTLFANEATQGAGAAATSELALPPIANVIAWSNVPPGLDGTFELRFSCIEGGAGGPGSVGSAPLFRALPAPGPDGRYGTADDVPGDLRLAGGSPCIDAGDNTALLRGTELDLDGRPRFADDPLAVDGGVPAPPCVDLGPFERQPEDAP